MKTITFMSFKGGAGKSTSLYLLVAALNERGKRVAVINADRNNVLHEWRDYGRGCGTWDETIKVSNAVDDEDLSKAAEEAESFGADYLVIDTAGGGSDINDAILYNSDMVVIPCDLGQQELDQTLQTLQYVQQYLAETGGNALSGFLLNRVPLSNDRFSVDEAECWDVVKSLPIFGTRIPDDKRIKGQKTRGLMNLFRDQLESAKASRFRAPHYTRLLRIGHDLVDEIDAAFGEMETGLGREVERDAV